MGKLYKDKSEKTTTDATEFKTKFEELETACREHYKVVCDMLVKDITKDDDMDDDEREWTKKLIMNPTERENQIKTKLETPGLSSEKKQGYLRMKNNMGTLPPEKPDGDMLKVMKWQKKIAEEKMSCLD